MSQQAILTGKNGLCSCGLLQSSVLSALRSSVLGRTQFLPSEDRQNFHSRDLADHHVKDTGLSFEVVYCLQRMDEGKGYLVDLGDLVGE